MGKNNVQKTNGWDFLNNLIDNFFNLFKISSAVSLLFIWLVIREARVVFFPPNDFDYNQLLLTKDLIALIVNSDNKQITYLAIAIVIIIVFVLITIGLILYVKRLKKEIRRLTALRQELMHGLESGKLNTLEVHNSSI